ncbi:hypothetical protein V6Z11_A06G204800 [Gossypium hirsutum]
MLLKAPFFSLEKIEKRRPLCPLLDSSPAKEKEAPMARPRSKSGVRDVGGQGLAR